MKCPKSGVQWNSDHTGGSHPIHGQFLLAPGVGPCPDVIAQSQPEQPCVDCPPPASYVRGKPKYDISQLAFSDYVPPYIKFDPTSPKIRESIHFVTTLTQSFYLGLRCLLLSLTERSNIDYKFTVVTLDKIAPFSKLDLSSLADISWIDARELGNVPQLSTTRDRLAPNFNKLLMWNLPLDGDLIFIDSDTLCVGDLTQLLSWTPMIVVRNFARYEIKRRGEANYRCRARPIWNSGVFCFHPNHVDANGIAALAKTYTAVQLGDQEILNDYFNEYKSDEVEYADYGYNYRTYLGLPADVRILHFAHAEKPWKDQPIKEHQVPAFKLWQSVISGHGEYEQFIDLIRNVK